MIDPNEPAFPCETFEESGNAMLGEVPVKHMGMTIRTEIATRIMPTILNLIGGSGYQIASQQAVLATDALIAELNGTENRLHELIHFKDSSIGLFCIDQDPKTVSHEWIVEHAFQLK